MAGKDISRQDGDTKLFVNHKPKNTHLCRTSVIKLNRPLLQLGRIIKLVPSKVKLSITEITDELRLVIQPIGIAIHDLRNHEEGGHLHQDVHAVFGVEERLPRGEAIGDVLGSGEADSGGGGEVSGDGEHGNAGVFDFGFAEPVEVDSDIIDVGKAEGVESDISSHGSVKERRPVQERKGCALLGIQRNGSPGGRGGRGEGGSRSG
mmetsp:Transcript_4147/g.7961  ORF Transcript_4147/g.7961 Transcript_4147/m.7961 type:complete len:206 (+) Transcript_4147:329-946(+)